MIGGGDGTITLFDAACKDYAQTELRGGVVAMSFSPDRTEARGIDGSFSSYPTHQQHIAKGHISRLNWCLVHDVLGNLLRTAPD